jgi:putative tricarboxylic transport membrane protein
MIGLFGMSEVFYVLIKKEKKMEYKQEQGFPRIRLDILAKNKLNIMRSTLVGLWVGFIPGVGESAACWLSYDVAKRSSKTKEQFGKGNPEGVIAAETANNASSVGALIPALALGVPGSATAAIFIAALFMMNHRPGPTLMLDSPGILAQICVLFLLGAILMIGIGYVLTRYVIRFLTIPNKYLMPIVTVFCALGAYGSTYTWSSVIFVLLFGLIGAVMKLYQYPIAPMVLGLLVGNIADSSLRRALMQYSHNPLEMVTRPFGIAVIVVLVIMFILGVKTNITQEDVEKEIEE